MNKIVVIGSGASGLCVAYHLVKNGYNVAVVDQIAFAESPAAAKMSRQIHRPFYLEQDGLDFRAQTALASWKEIFTSLQRDYFVPKGVISVSTAEGDWTERCMNTLIEHKQHFRLVDTDQMPLIMGGFKLENARYGILSEFGGEFLAAKILWDLQKWLTDHGVEFHFDQAAKRAGDSAVKLENGELIEGDYVIVTGGLNEFMPDAFENLETFRAYYAEVAPKDLSVDILWRFTPCWIDLGGESHLWGTSYNDNAGRIKIGAGSLTHEYSDSMPDLAFMRARLLDIYSDYIRDFSNYELCNFEAIDYKSFSEGHFAIKREGQFIGLLGDCGHGFKFAAENAKYLVEALATENFRIAARKLKGSFAAQHLS